jgi:class III poly(R)-hydroxyalkanoic acid synthase PhaE subunit
MKEASRSISLVKHWIELSDFCWSFVYSKTLSSLAQMPLLGPNRSFNHQLLKAFDAWVKLYPTSANYQMVLVEIQLQAIEDFLKELLLLLEKEETVQDWSQLQHLWSHTADKAFEQAFRSEDNLKIRGGLLNAMSHYQLCQQEIIEGCMKAMNLPIRSEVDEVHKSIYELRKEVKSLKKIIENQKQRAPT